MSENKFTDIQMVSKIKREEAKRLMSSDQLKKCNWIIHSAAVESGAGGAIPIPVADAFLIAPGQILMVVLLGKVFGDKITRSAAISLIISTSSTFIGRNIVKYIPIVGWGFSAAVAAGVTEAMGWAVAVNMATQYNSKTKGDVEKNGFSDSQDYTDMSKTSEQMPNDEKDTEPSSDESKNNNSEDEDIKELISHAEEFIQGSKSCDKDKAEYRTLLEKIEAQCQITSKEHTLYRKLQMARKELQGLDM